MGIVLKTLAVFPSAVDPPKLRVSVEGDTLNLSWTPPEVSKDCSWTYELCYSKCDEREVLLLRV